MTIDLAPTPPTTPPRPAVPANRSAGLRRPWPTLPRQALAGAFAVAVVAVVPFWWIDHAQGPGATLTGLGQVTGFWCSLAALASVLLMARIPLLDETIGTDRGLAWHRWTATATIGLLVVHIVATTLGYAVGAGATFWHQYGDFLGSYPDLVTATVAAALLGLVTLSSIRVLRRRIPYEAWLFGHWYVYPAMFLAFGHELSDGSSFVRAEPAVLVWTWLHVAVLVAVVWYRVLAPAGRMWRHRLVVEAVVPQGLGAAAIVLRGHDLDDYEPRAGQHVRLRFLSRSGWWQSHPYSLSAAPRPDRWRVTVVAAGDGTAEAVQVPVGTHAVVSGVYGNLVADARRSDRVVLIGGGSGIAPLRAILEDLPAGVDAAVLYRARSHEMVLHEAELRDLARATGAHLAIAVGPRNPAPDRDLLSPAHLLEAVPDLAQRDAFVCGTKGFVDRVEASLRVAGVPAEQLHTERFDP